MSIKKEDMVGFPVKNIVFSEGVVRMVIEKVPKYGLYIYAFIFTTKTWVLFKNDFSHNTSRSNTF